MAGGIENGTELSVVAIAAAAISAAATTSAATATVAAAPAGRALFARPRFVHRQGPPLELLAMKLGDGRVGLGLGAHFNKCKTARTSGGAILHDVHCDDGARRCKIILQIIFGGTEGKIPNE